MLKIQNTTMLDLPSYINYVFIFTVIATFGFLYSGFKIAEKNNSNTALIVSGCLLIWLGIVAVLALNDFFVDYESMPPKFLLAILPPNLLTIVLLFTEKGRAFMASIPLATMTYLHMIRVPIEIVLWWLALNKVLPLLLTFEGANYDILSGITAPFIAIFMTSFKRKNTVIPIIWNFLALGLLINIVVYAVLSTPLPFQQFAFYQPNIAVFYFPIIWLPSFVVPAVFFAHVTSLYQLFTQKEEA
ncbi:MAG: hypothetical protein OCD76_21760 [Reichenbachiella sp.]